MFFLAEIGVVACCPQTRENTAHRDDYMFKLLIKRHLIPHVPTINQTVSCVGVGLMDRRRCDGGQRMTMTKTDRKHCDNKRRASQAIDTTIMTFSRSLLFYSVLLYSFNARHVCTRLRCCGDMDGSAEATSGRHSIVENDGR